MRQALAKMFLSCAEVCDTLIFLIMHINLHSFLLEYLQLTLILDIEPKQDFIICFLVFSYNNVSICYYSRGIPQTVR
jgi:hypothetical protein